MSAESVIKGYLVIGFVWWLFEQIEYVEPVKPFWQGFGNLQTSSTPGNILISAQTILFWPYSLQQTMAMQLPGA